MKIITWNVNGIRAVIKKGFLDFAEDEKPDVLCVQEIKAHPDQVDELLEDYPHHYWNPAERKGYSGTAVFSKVAPISNRMGIGVEEHDNEGRVITLEFKDYYVVNVYVPNSGQELKRLDYREEWDKAFLKYLKKLESKKPVILTGDLNVAHQPIDLKNDKANYNKTAGYTQTEIDGFDRLLKNGFVDVFRKLNPDKVQYTYWSYRFNARKNNAGWRIDYFLVSEKLMKKVKDIEVLSDVMGSDHCPVALYLK